LPDAMDVEPPHAVNVEPPHTANVEPPHADPGPVDVARLAAALRGDKLIKPDLLAAYRPELLVAEPGGPVARLAGRAGFRLRHARPIPVAEAMGGERLAVVAEPAGSPREACRALGRELGLPSGAVWLEPVGRLPHNGNGKIDRPAVRRVLAARAEARAGGDD
jgi:acyl-CoA synthetase (AMP-forming)/AMP-acid ligase II